jgi:branched-chain amino acid transport system substrate-binding protein
MKKLFLSAVCACAVMLTGCGIQQWSNTVKVGVISPLSWPSSTYGIDAVNAYKFVVDKYNATTTGTHIELIIEDGKCDGKASTDAAQKLITVDKIDLLVVASCSASSVAAGKIAQEAKIVNIHSLSVSPAISSLGEYVFRYPNGADVGEKMWTYANKHRKSINLVTEKTEFCKAIKEVILKTYTWIVINDLSFESTEKDFGILAKQIVWSPAEWLFAITQSDATSTSVIKALAAEGQLDKYRGNIVGFSTFGLPPFLKNIGKLSEGLLQYNYGAMYKLPQIGKDFLDDFQKTNKIHSDPWFVIIFAESMMLVTNAISQGNNTSETIKAYLERITKDSKRDGLFGPYYFDTNGDVVSVPFHLQQIKNGKLEFIE